MTRSVVNTPLVRATRERVRKKKGEEREKDLVGKLVMSLYGTRDAAANFQKEVSKFEKNWMQSRTI